MALAKMSQLLRARGVRLLRNEPGAFLALFRKQQQDTVMAQVECDLQHMRDVVTEAWRRRDYRAVVAEYSPRQVHLTPSELKRFEIASKRLNMPN